MLWALPPLPAPLLFESRDSQKHALRNGDLQTNTTYRRNSDKLQEHSWNNTDRKILHKTCLIFSWINFSHFSIHFLFNLCSYLRIFGTNLSIMQVSGLYVWAFRVWVSNSFGQHPHLKCIHPITEEMCLSRGLSDKWQLPVTSTAQNSK